MTDVTPAQARRIAQALHDTPPPRLTARRPSGWRIDWPYGARLATITAPCGEAVDALQAVSWDWNPPEGGSSRMTGPPPTEDDLARWLAEYVEENGERHLCGWTP